MIGITQSQYDTSKQTNRELHLRVELLNFNFNIVEQLEGNVFDGDITIDSNSDLRRSCHISMVVTDSTFNPAAGGKIWIDKLIKIYVGIRDAKTGEIVENNMGIYLINEPTYDYEAQTHTLKFEGLDLASKLTGARNGYLTGVIYKVSAGARVRDVIITCLTENGFNNYVVNDCINSDGTLQNVPMDYEFEQGSTWWDIITKMRNILPNYQTYFDVDGIFHYEPIPYTTEEPILITDDLWQENVVSENITVDFSSVKNDIEIWGATHSLNYYGDSSVTTISGNNISTAIASVSSLQDNMLIGFVLPNNVSGNLTLNVSSLGAHNIVDENGNYVTSLEKDIIWCVIYDSINSVWKFIGHQQAQAKIVDDNPDSPFYVESTTGHIKIALFGGEYDDIQSDYLAMQRAKFELYTRCRLNDTLTLTTVPIYWIDVNIKVSYTSLNKEETNEYMIKSVSIPLSENSTMSVVLSKFYPYYPIM